MVGHFEVVLIAHDVLQAFDIFAFEFDNFSARRTFHVFMMMPPVRVLVIRRRFAQFGLPDQAALFQDI